MSSAIRLVAFKSQYVPCLRLLVKPGQKSSAKGRIIAVNEESIHIAVSARAHNGEANEMLLQLLSEKLQVPKSKFQIVHGGASPRKVVVLKDIKGDISKFAESIHQKLVQSIES